MPKVGVRRRGTETETENVREYFGPQKRHFPTAKKNNNNNQLNKTTFEPCAAGAKTSFLVELSLWLVRSGGTWLIVCVWFKRWFHHFDGFHIGPCSLLASFLSQDHLYSPTVQAHELQIAQYSMLCSDCSHSFRRAKRCIGA